MPKLYISFPLQHRGPDGIGSGGSSPVNPSLEQGQKPTGDMDDHSVTATDTVNHTPETNFPKAKDTKISERSVRSEGSVSLKMSASQLSEYEAIEAKLLNMADNLFKKQQDKSLIDNAKSSLNTLIDNITANKNLSQDQLINLFSSLTKNLPSSFKIIIADEGGQEFSLLPPDSVKLQDEDIGKLLKFAFDLINDFDDKEFTDYNAKQVQQEIDVVENLLDKNGQVIAENDGSTGWKSQFEVYKNRKSNISLPPQTLSGSQGQSATALTPQQMEDMTQKNPQLS